MIRKTSTLSLSLLITSIALSHAGDLKITLDQAPAAVQQAVKAQAGSNKIVRVEKADEDGQIQYEVLTKKSNGKKIEFIINADGTLNSTEEPIALADLSDKIADTSKTAIGTGKVEAVERVTKDGAVTYEVGYKSAQNEKREAVVSSDGKLLKDGPDTD